MGTMGQKEFSTEWFTESVVAVPPLAWGTDFTPNFSANELLLKHIEAGGVTNVLYGGNANVYHIANTPYVEVLKHLLDVAAPETRILPSFGPDFGKMIEQAQLFRVFEFATALALPCHEPVTQDGIETGLRMASEAFGKPLIIYIKRDGYIESDRIARLFEQGHACAIKYAVPRNDVSADPYLSEICEAVSPTCIISGIGERPAVDHLKIFGLAGFTSGLVCIAPRGSMELLRALNSMDYQSATDFQKHYLPMEDLRDEHGPIPVLHDAVTLSGIADMGPMLPMLSGTQRSLQASIQEQAIKLLETDAALNTSEAA